MKATEGLFEEIQYLKKMGLTKEEIQGYFEFYDIKIFEFKTKDKIKIRRRENDKIKIL
jgi:hypothetical protein